MKTLLAITGGIVWLASIIENQKIRGIGNANTDYLIINDTSWNGKSIKELKDLAKQHFTQSFQGKSVYNRDKGIEIILPQSGIKHSINNKYLLLQDFLVGKNIAKIIETAIFKNIGKPKPNRIDEIGYYNFWNTSLINGKKVEIKITVRLIKMGKSKIKRFYYDHYTIKEKP